MSAEGGPRRGLPGLAGGDHIGITVPDLDAGVAFFVDVIGCEHIFDGGRVGGDPAFMRERLNVHPDASLRYCFLRCGHGLNLELFEYSAPGQRTEPPCNSDAGGHHVAFHVDDVHAAAAYLRERGIRVLGDPMSIDGGPAAGSTWVYFLAPWGLQLELVSYPRGKAYERTARRRLWNPRFPAR